MSVRSTVVVALLLSFALAQADKPSPAQERIDAAGKTFQMVEKRWEMGSALLDEVYLWSVRWLTAQRDATTDKQTLADVADSHLKRMQAVEEHVGKMVAAGIAPMSDQTAAEYFRAEAEMWSAQAHGK
jgi:hypothetical protein